MNARVARTAAAAVAGVVLLAGLAGCSSDRYDQVCIDKHTHHRVNDRRCGRHADGIGWWYVPYGYSVPAIGRRVRRRTALTGRDGAVQLRQLHQHGVPRLPADQRRLGAGRLSMRRARCARAWDAGGAAAPAGAGEGQGRVMMTYWHPVGTAPGNRHTAGRLPVAGQLIACADRRAYRVTHVDEVNPADWDPKTIKAWERKGRPDPENWDGREWRLRLDPVRHPKPENGQYTLLLYPWQYTVEQWWPLDDPYPACVECGQLWPCPCYDRNREAEKATAELDRLGGILPGCCWACGEPVTGRHRSIVFDGENLLLPGAGPAVFHTSHSRKAHRRTCRGLAVEYEKRWVAAEPDRAVRLTCRGHLWRHFDWSECSEGDRCTGVDADHGQLVLGTDGQPRRLVKCGACGGRDEVTPLMESMAGEGA